MKHTELGIDAARRALLEAGHSLTETDPMPAELLDVLSRYDLPLSTLVGFVHFRPKGAPPITSALFAQHCQQFTGAPVGARNQEAGICPQCNAHPTQRAGGFLVCTSGRCSPIVAA